MDPVISTCPCSTSQLEPNWTTSTSVSRTSKSVSLMWKQHQKHDVDKYQYHALPDHPYRFCANTTNANLCLLPDVDSGEFGCQGLVRHVFDVVKSTLTYTLSIHRTCPTWITSNFDVCQKHSTYTLPNHLTCPTWIASNFVVKNS